MYNHFKILTHDYHMLTCHLIDINDGSDWLSKRFLAKEMQHNSFGVSRVIDRDHELFGKIITYCTIPSTGSFYVHHSEMQKMLPAFDKKQTKVLEDTEVLSVFTSDGILVTVINPSADANVEKDRVCGSYCGLVVDGSKTLCGELITYSEVNPKYSFGIYYMLSGVHGSTFCNDKK